MDRALVALALVVISIAIVLGLTRGYLEVLAIAPILAAAAYYALLRDWD
jgi:hypothetical protein